MMDLRYRQIRLDGTESRSRTVEGVHRIEGQFSGNDQWTRLWFEGEGHQIIATEVPYRKGRLEIEAL